MLNDFWAVYFKYPDENEEPMDVSIVKGTEADVQELVCDLTFEEMYEDFCVEVNCGFSVEQALEDKTATCRDDYGYRWHYVKAKRFINF